MKAKTIIILGNFKTSFTKLSQSLKKVGEKFKTKQNKILLGYHEV